MKSATNIEIFENIKLKLNGILSTTNFSQNFRFPFGKNPLQRVFKKVMRALLWRKPDSANFLGNPFQRKNFFFAFALAANNFNNRNDSIKFTKHVKLSISEVFVWAAKLFSFCSFYLESSLSLSFLISCHFLYHLSTFVLCFSSFISQPLTNYSALTENLINWIKIFKFLKFKKFRYFRMLRSWNIIKSNFYD